MVFCGKHLYPWCKIEIFASVILFSLLWCIIYGGVVVEIAFGQENKAVKLLRLFLNRIKIVSQIYNFNANVLIVAKYLIPKGFRG
jgi:hypothetical protein